MSTTDFWNEDDYPSSGDEARNDRTRRNRETHTNRNIERVRTALTSPESQSRSFAAALNTIREDALVKAQFQRIEEIWTLKHDRVLADALYTEVTLAILQAANAVASAGQNLGNEDEESYAARHAARARTVGNYQWTELGTSAGRSSTAASGMSTPQEEQPQFDLGAVKARLT